MELLEYLTKSISDIPKQGPKVADEDVVLITDIDTTGGPGWEHHLIIVRGDYFTRTINYLAKRSKYYSKYGVKGTGLIHDINVAQRGFTNYREDRYAYIYIPSTSEVPSISVEYKTFVYKSYHSLMSKGHKIKAYSKQTYDPKEIEQFIDMNF